LNRLRSAAAFTLLEVLVAVIMLGALMAAAAGLVGVVLVGSRRVDETIDADLAVAEADEIIADDLAFLAAIPGKPPIVLRERSDGASYVSFYSAAGAKAAWGELAVPVHLVTYMVEPIAGGSGKGLFRLEEPLVEWKGSYYDSALLLVGPVESMTVEAYDGEAWHTVWPDAGASGMPVLIRLTVTFPGDEEGARHIYVETAPSVECVTKPQAERRASGGTKKEDESTANLEGTFGQPDNWPPESEAEEPAEEQE